ncbi:hypothetical protein [Helicobacter pylori]|uniref:F2 n=1 Tax=Helicobacter pylori TaxID=210 RepID=Q3LR57_HELPX|nr:hypothetical protein [Helicobacter pylori]ABA26019.1 F2 [Helicobacter pylori]ABQ18309.1 hypothetical protein [Cloning vector pTM117]EIE30640.1 Hypothetical protein HP17_06107 [Helicobacter pylori NCTC 11637 = CCUG 17874 = ATCC 43504 = JCM 12093]
MKEYKIFISHSWKYDNHYANLQDALKDLAEEIQPKVYEYGFLRE